jgi:hypothetical protein
MTTLSNEEINMLVKEFTSFETGDGRATQIVRSISFEQLNEFTNGCNEVLDDITHRWCTLNKMPFPLGARHPAVPYEYRRRAEILDMEWRARTN